MMKRFNVFVLLLVLGLVMALGRTPEAKAGLYNADGEVTYKEYWMPHSEFTAGCAIPGINDKPNSWYTEPDTMAKCPKTMTLTIPDDFSGALKAELYVDLWRNYDTRSARLRINGNPNKVYQPLVGYDWSRTPWIQEIPISELVMGANTFLFWGESGKYHIHDVALRIYYDDTHPLAAGGANPDTTPPDGELVSIRSLDPSEPLFPAYDGGVLKADLNKIELTANVTEAAIVEFHAYYDGYDDDNDGQTRDWHSVNRNNWHPGGKPEKDKDAPGPADPPATGGTINHIGTIKVTDPANPVTIIWEIPHIINQSGVKFKIRIIDASGNVREAPGGATPGYTLVRNYSVVYYTMPNFDDFGLHMSGNRPDIVTYQFPLPIDLNLGEVSRAYLLGMYWRTPDFTLNGSAKASVRKAWSTIPNPQPWLTDSWSLGVRELSKTSLLPGANTISYFYKSGTGQFIEHPGPMIVLHGNPGPNDTFAPGILSRSPAPGSTNVNIFSPVTVRVGDSGVGVDKDSIIMSVNNTPVEPVMSGPSNNLSLTYTPSVPFPTETSIRVTVYACDLLGNCMTSSDEYYFQTEAPDMTPPVISNVLVNSANTTATVTWKTDEAASSLVEWGALDIYEKPSVSDPALVTSHTIQLAGLQSNTTYNYRLTSIDYFGNTVVTGNFTFQTKRDPGAILSDEFSGCTLDTSVWSYINPLNDSSFTMTGAGVQISVPANGTSHDLWKQGLQAPRLMQFVTDQNFNVEVKFDSTIDKKTQTMGVLVQQDATNWLRFNFQNNGLNDNSLVVVDSKNNNPVVISTTPSITMGAANYMRVSRSGNYWNLEYSNDGKTWIYAATVERALTMSAIGPFVGNTGTNPAHNGIIDYFENRAIPLSGGDVSLTLDIGMVGLGAVTRDPDKVSYQCNEKVELTAVPAAEWGFGGWSGAINSVSPTTSIIITQPANVVATFTNDTPYAVEVNVVSNGDGTGGTVTKNPDQSLYLYGDMVTLTATPTPGWTFTGWSGSFVGTDPMASVSVNGDMNITATFDEDEYRLDTMILADGVGEGGTISVDPEQSTYKYGDVVTLSLTLDPGWMFIGWEGEGVSGTATTLPLTMTQNVVAVAHIAQNQYDLRIDYINNGDDEGLGNGVIRDPERETYGYGQVVTLVASPDLGWEFGGWGGALSGTELTRTLEITQDNVITATFNQLKYELVVTSAGHGSVTVSPQKDYYLYGDVVTLDPVPEQGYDFVLWHGDKTGTEDPLVFAVTGDVTVEAVFEVDTTPIEILSHGVEVLGTVAVVTWTTDVPGNSQVQYGLTTEYGGGTETKEPLVLVHTITLTGLEPEKLYYYMIQSMDEFGNTVTLGDHFSTSTSSGLASDDFSSCQLSDRWTWDNGPLDDGQYSMTGTGVSISVPAGTRHNIWTDGIGAPRLMQASNNTDFTIEVKFDSPMVDGGTMQGIFIQQDDQTFVRFNFYKRADPAALVYHVYTFSNLTQKQVSDNAAQPDNPGPMYMRIIRLGDKWEQWISFDGENWTRNVKFDFPMVVKRVGVFAGNDKFKGNFPAHTAVIDYFVNTASAIPLDESFYKITSSVEGSGQIKFQPSKTGYYCGQEVAVLATGAPGWSFAGWAGDISGSLPSRTITVNNDMNIIARFQQGAAGFRLLLPLTIDNTPNKR